MRQLQWFPVFIGFSLLIGIAACRKEPGIPAIPEDYRTWDRTTHLVLDYPIPGHENHFRQIYINALGEQLQITKRNNRRVCEFPEGTIIVKEIYSDLNTPGAQESPVLLTVMIKAPRHPKARGGWLWVSQDYATKETHLIDYEFCVDCHANANEQHVYGDRNPDNEFRDYVFFLPGHDIPRSDTSQEYTY
jgi:hypothetical protein